MAADIAMAGYAAIPLQLYLIYMYCKNKVYLQYLLALVYCPAVSAEKINCTYTENVLQKLYKFSFQ